jgi:RHS repeat-associated protein
VEDKNRRMKYKKPLRQIWLTCMGVISFTVVLAQAWNPGHKVGTVTGAYNYNPSQVPSQLVEIFPAAVPNTGLTYQWEQSSTPTFDNITIIGTSSSGPVFSAALSQNSYFRRKTTKTSTGEFIYSNTVKLSLVSANWENINYVREHNIRTSGVTSWTTVDLMAIGPKIQTTTYLDGLGRKMETVSRETATPSSGSLWGDLVQFSEYDQIYGRENKKHLPYSTTTESGKFKTTPLTEQPSYYTANYSETHPYSTIIYEASPLNRVEKVKQPGASWNTVSVNGIGAQYELNTTTDEVRIFKAGYVQGDPPITSDGFYPEKSLYKTMTLDENQKKVIEFTNMSGQLVLKKVELDDTHPTAHGGWICTYNVYDEFDQLRFQIQPEGVKYLEANSWLFLGTNGQSILNEQCFQYFYDDKGRVTWKKAPGAKPLSMIYDDRDRIVFMQDGNQSMLSTPQWTTNLYDELDRVIITTLYNSNKSKSTLQSDITNAVTITTVTITNPAQPLNDLLVNNRATQLPNYFARNSIEFTDGFESLTDDNWVAEINASTSFPSTVTVTTYKNPISQTDLNNSSVSTILKYLFYDNYNFDGVKSFNTNFTNLTAYSTSDPDVMPITASNRTISMQTGSKTRILGSDVFLSSTSYYDDRGQPIQTLADNAKLGTDINTFQHHFDGRTISACLDHSAPNTGYSNFKTLTKYIFDKLGRVISLQKQFGSNPIKTVASYNYDDMGRVKTKHLDPGYSGGNDLESLNYSYNIHNQITGINKDYALKTPGNYNKWGHFFGLFVGYDKTDGVFAASNLNGQVTGLLWNTQGDDAQRKYDYTYDHAGRLTSGIFKEQKHTGDGFSNTTMDFSVSGNSGKIIYDLNGNLLNMLHRGVIPGTASPIDADKLSYAYEDYSNKLKKVTDQTTSTSVNGLFADFKDGANGSDPDYVYDDNGNLVIDLNKNVQSLNGGAAGTKGIQYNYLDKPELIRLVGKGTVKIIYSADGQKLQRAFIPEAGGSSVITTYINGFTYQETATITTSTTAPLGGGNATLSFINFEEGRIRPVTPVSYIESNDELAVDGNMDLPNGKRGAYDYFIMDYQQNVRMILTEETHHVANTATMESNRSTLEESIFGQTGAGNEVSSTRVAKPLNWTKPTVLNSVSRLGTNFGHNIGPNTLQKVMAGDRVTATVDYYFETAATGNNTSFKTEVLGSLAQAIGGSSANNLVKNNASSITTQLGGVFDFTSAVLPNGTNPSGPILQAYCTFLFFDERFNFISAADGGVAQEQVEGTVGINGKILGLQNLQNVKSPKNGYVFVYVSNQSNEAVYFDNLKVKIDAGNIIEENHYYSYGLRIAAISSKKAGESNEGALKNNYLYNAKELFEDGDLNWYDYGFRNYDPQIGRFTQLDPLTFSYPFYTPYQFSGNEPIGNIDLDGLEPSNVTSYVSSVAKSGATVTGVEVVKAGKWAGKWAVAGFKDGVAFRHVFTKTGQLWERLAIAAQALGSASQTISVTNNYLHLRQGMGNGDMSTNHSIPSNSQIGVNQLGSALNAIKKDYHPLSFEEKGRHGLPQGGRINHSTGDVIPYRTSIDMVDGPETWIPMVLSGAVLSKLSQPIVEGAVLKGGATGAQYSVAYEMKLASNLYPGKSYYTHFQAANKSLSNAMASDAAFSTTISKLGITIPRSSTGTIGGTSPTNWVWHHDINAGVMQLVPKSQHTLGSTFWKTMHPNGMGGMAIWGN